MLTTFVRKMSGLLTPFGDTTEGQLGVLTYHPLALARVLILFTLAVLRRPHEGHLAFISPHITHNDCLTPCFHCN